MPDAHRMYGELAPWWPKLSPPDDYAEEAQLYHGVFQQFGTPGARDMLELGCGGGNNALHLKRHYTMTLVDLAPGMLLHSQALNPECEHHLGDMRSVRLGREFDFVFMHDAVCYMTSREDLAAAIETARVHCRAGGVVLLAPDYTAESFEEGTEHGGSDDGGSGMRYLSWVYDPDPADTTYIVDYAFLLREASGDVRVVHDRHIEGLFPAGTWLALLTEAGFAAHHVRVSHSEVDRELDLFVGVRA